jgi:hypothetical protein
MAPLHYFHNYPPAFANFIVGCDWSEAAETVSGITEIILEYDNSCLALSLSSLFLPFFLPTTSSPHQLRQQSATYAFRLTLATFTALGVPS